MQHPNPTSALIDKIIGREFNPRRIATPKSEPYIDGFRAGLTKQMENRDLPMPYKAGTAAADAYLAGKADGRAFPRPTEIDETDAAEVSA